MMARQPVQLGDLRAQGHDAHKHTHSCGFKKGGGEDSVDAEGHELKAGET